MFYFYYYPQIYYHPYILSSQYSKNIFWQHIPSHIVYKPPQPPQNISLPSYQSKKQVYEKPNNILYKKPKYSKYIKEIIL